MAMARITGGVEVDEDRGLWKGAGRLKGFNAPGRCAADARARGASGAVWLTQQAPFRSFLRRGAPDESAAGGAAGAAAGPLPMAAEECVHLVAARRV